MKTKAICLLGIFFLAALPLSAWERGYQLDPHMSLSRDVLDLPGGHMLWLAEAQKVTLLETNMGGDSLNVLRFAHIESTLFSYNMEYGIDSTIWIVGYYYNGTEWNIGIIKLDSECNLLDYKTYDIYRSDMFPVFKFDSDYNCIIAGYQVSSGDYMGWIFKTDSDGNLLWADTLDCGGRVMFYDVLIASNNTYYLVGSIQDTVDWNAKSIVIQIDEDGDSLNGVVLPFDSTFTFSAELAGDSAIYLFGQTAPAGAWYYTAWIAMLDLDLNFLWQKTYDFYSQSYIFGSEQISDNRIILGYNDFMNIGLIVFDAMNADTISTLRYSTPGTTKAGKKLRVMSNGDYAVAGVHSAGLTRCLGFRVDSLGNHVPAVIAETTLLPSTFSLSAYPNPFNSSVTITLDCRGLINQTPTVEIFDLNGRKIDVIARRAEPNEAISPNNRSSVPLDTRRDAVSINNCEFVWQPDESLPSGVYLVRARVGGRGDLAPTGQAATKRIVYLK
jgi:hypothetical protein